MSDQLRFQYPLEELYKKIGFESIDKMIEYGMNLKVIEKEEVSFSQMLLFHLLLYQILKLLLLALY